MSSQTFYPTRYVNYGTLSLPNTITNQCVDPQCPSDIQTFPYNRYVQSFTKEQIEKDKMGLIKYQSGNHPSVNVNACPVYNSNTNMTLTKFMRYQK